MTDEKCQHTSFVALVAVNRIIDDEDGVTLKAIDASVAIRCGECNVPMCFMGIDRFGLDPNGVTVSPDFQEVRFPIVPQGETLPGMSIGYSIKPMNVQPGGGHHA